MAFVPGPVAQQLQRLGLQVLLEPRTSAVVFRAASATVGTLYPVYASFKAIEEQEAQKQKQQQEDSLKQWLTYWTVYGAFSLVENCADNLLSWFPYYHHAKFVFLVWLQLPQTQGAKKLYLQGIQPLLRKYRPKIDVVLQWWLAQLGVLYAVYKVPLELLVAVASTAGAGAHDFLHWFFSDPKGSSDRLSGM